MNQPENRKSRLASLSLAMGVLAVVLPVLGALGTRMGLWSFGVGLLLAPVGLLFAIIGLVLGSIALPRLRRAGAPLGGVAAGAGLSALVLLYLGGATLSGFSVPPIHNVSTDIADPPAFTTAASLRGDGDNPLSYDSETIGPIQREFYPELTSLVTQLPRDQVYELAREVLVDMGLELTREAPEQGEIEAVATTFWFGFKDDVAVRLRETDAGTRMDVRSVSRVGVSDLGANADRISEIINRVQARL